ncbi:copper chaperone PCu(A)C, partial [Vibrio vulnificus]|uniref:copper chaperone PCu(A)C n=1 Tax=Vibrio vulnificus TaxID=672 RepID=UPI001F42868E
MDLMAHHPYARAMAPGAVNSAVFVELMNRSDNVRTIVAAETPAAGKVDFSFDAVLLPPRWARIALHRRHEWPLHVR